MGQQEEDESALPRVAHIVDALLQLEKGDAEAVIRLWRRRQPSPDLSWLQLEEVRPGRRQGSHEYQYRGILDNEYTQRVVDWLVGHYPQLRINIRPEVSVYGRPEPLVVEVRVEGPVRIAEVP